MKVNVMVLAYFSGNSLLCAWFIEYGRVLKLHKNGIASDLLIKY
jgi:hypothetical protein